MREGLQRQMISRLASAGCLLALAGSMWAAPEEELRAARLLEYSVLARRQDPATRDSAGAESARLAVVYRELVTRYPRHSETRNAYAGYLQSIERPIEAALEWEKAAALDPKNAEAAFRLSSYRLSSGLIREANDLLERAVKVDPGNALYRYHLATASFLFRHQIGGSEADAVLLRALDQYRESTRLDPINVEYARGYAETFYGLPDPDWKRAREAWLHFLEISPDKDFAYSNLARVSVRLGQKEEARAFLGKIKSDRFERVKVSLIRQMEQP